MVTDPWEVVGHRTLHHPRKHRRFTARRHGGDSDLAPTSGNLRPGGTGRRYPLRRPDGNALSARHRIGTGLNDPAGAERDPGHHYLHLGRADYELRPWQAYPGTCPGLVSELAASDARSSTTAQFRWDTSGRAPAIPRRTIRQTGRTDSNETPISVPDPVAQASRDALIGGGGSIAMTAGMSRLYSFPPYFLLISVAILPGPVSIILSRSFH